MSDVVQGNKQTMGEKTGGTTVSVVLKEGAVEHFEALKGDLKRVKTL